MYTNQNYEKTRKTVSRCEVTINNIVLATSAF